MICLKCRNRIEDFSAFKGLILINQSYILESSRGVDVKPNLTDLPSEGDMDIKCEVIPEQVQLINPDPAPLVITAVASLPDLIQFANVHIVVEDIEEDDGEEHYNNNNNHDHQGPTTNPEEPEKDPLAGTGIELIVLADEDMDASSFILDSRNEDPMEDPFPADNESVPETINEDDGEDSPRRESSRISARPPFNYFSMMDVDDALGGGSAVGQTSAKQKRDRENRVQKRKGNKDKYQIDKKMQKQKREEIMHAHFTLQYAQWSQDLDGFIQWFYPTLSCKFCDETFTGFKNLRLHVQSTHQDEKAGFFSCCGRDFLTRRHVSNHIQFHVLPTHKRACKRCLIVLDTNKMFHQHTANFHATSEPIPCESCPEMSSTQVEWDKHFVTHLLSADVKSNPGFACKVCAADFESQFLKLSHENEVHGLHSQQLTCLTCGYKATNFQDYTTHYGGHSGKSLALDCPDCDLLFPSLRELRVHLMGVKINNKKKKISYACRQ